MRYVYEAVVADKEGNKINAQMFSSEKAAKKWKPKTGHVTCICQWPVFGEKDIVEDGEV